MFRLGNFNIDEILFGTAQNFNDDLLYTLDQLSSASIEISAESTDITDKKGNVVRTLYTSKTGTFNATNAFLHPQIMAAGSGNEIERATSDSTIVMPKMVVVPAGKKLDITDADTTTIQVIGIFGNGANSAALTLGTAASYNPAKNTGEYFIDGTTLEVPAEAADFPIQYLVKYNRDVKDGIKLVNTSDKFPSTVRLTLQCSYMDPCSDTLKPCYVYIPSFMADPSMTISLDRETQEMDYNGTIQMDYCGVDKILYVIYFPDDELVSTGIID